MHILCTAFTQKRAMGPTGSSDDADVGSLEEDFMAIIQPDQIRNIALIGHSGCGKTTLAEALLFKAGVTTRMGSVPEKTSILDYTEDSREKLSSLDSAVCSFQHKGVHVNLIDTPGSASFCGAATSALSAVECGVLVISATAGIQVNTRKMMERARDYGIGTWIVINHIDAPNVNLPALLAQVQEQFGTKCVPITLPINGGKGVIDCLTATSGSSDLGDVGEDHTALIDAIVGADDVLMERYLGGEVSEDEVKAAAAKAVAKGEFVPVFFTNAKGNVGVSEFMDTLLVCCPSPVSGKRRVLVEGETKTEVGPSVDGAFIGQVFKISTDPKSNIKYLCVRVHSGKLTPDMVVKTLREPKGNRPGHTLRTIGAEHKEIELGSAGDIIALAKLDFHIGDTLCTGKPGMIAMPSLPKPMFALALESKTRGDEDKIGGALKRFSEEDPCFVTERGTGGELVIRGMGDLQLRTYLGRMAKHYKLEVDTRPPRIPYKETIIGTAHDIEYTH
ncbi:MAG: GTP-binding protein, partial [Planctomycetota bacterium]